MNDLLQNLLKLQTLEFDPTTKKDTPQMAALRALIPQPILAHYQRLVARGKKGLLAVRNQVCTGCHMHVPIGQINTIMQGTDIQLCENCGRYLYLPSPVAEPPAAVAPAPVKAARKPSKKKVALVHAA